MILVFSDVYIYPIIPNKSGRFQSDYKRGLFANIYIYIIYIYMTYLHYRRYSGTISKPPTSIGLVFGKPMSEESPSLSRRGRQVEAHPIVEYVHVQCQSCGRRVPDNFPAEEECFFWRKIPVGKW